MVYVQRSLTLLDVRVYQYLNITADYSDIVNILNISGDEANYVMDIRVYLHASCVYM